MFKIYEKKCPNIYMGDGKKELLRRIEKLHGESCSCDTAAPKEGSGSSTVASEGKHDGGGRRTHGGSAAGGPGRGE